jgi:hypothetical protein
MVNGFPFASLFAMLIVADFEPKDTGLKDTVKVALPPGAIVETAGWVTVNSEAFVPPFTIIGLPVRVRSSAPVFSMVNVLAPLEVFTFTFPKL